MKLIFKERFFSWFDSYDIYTEDGSVVYSVRGKLAWGHQLEIYNSSQTHLATLKERIISFLPQFDIQIGTNVIGKIKKEFTFLKPSFSIDCNGWKVEGSFWEWNYRIIGPSGQIVAKIQKQLLNFTDTYTIEISNPTDSLMALMVVLAIDAVKCSQNNN